MDKKIRILTPVFALAALAVISCGSSPKKAGGAKTDGASSQTASAPPVKEAEKPPVSYQRLGEIIAEAKEKREEITENKLEGLDMALVSQADDSLKNAETAYLRGESELSAAAANAAYEDAQFALLGYSAVLDKHYMVQCDDARKRSLAAREDALKVKADVAVKENYGAATETHESGEKSYRAKKYKQSYISFTESANLYAELAIVAAEKRRLAMLALQNAETKIAESERIATNAEALLNGAGGAQ
jgi:hypothetical protein